MEKSGGPQPTLVLDWQNNIASDASYTQFQTIVNLVYTIIFVKTLVLWFYNNVIPFVTYSLVDYGFMP